MSILKNSSRKSQQFLLFIMVFVCTVATLPGEVAKNVTDEKKPTAVASASTADKDSSSIAGIPGRVAKSKEGTPAAAKSEPAAKAGTPPDKKSPEPSFWPSWFQASVTNRGRFEKPSGRNYANDSGDKYYLNRLRVEATLKLGKYLDFYGMAQDSRVFEYNDPAKRPSGMMDSLELRSAYVDLHGKWEGKSMAMRVGRQSLDIGSRRLVGVATWGNSPPVFDAAKLSFGSKGVSVDVFAASRVSTVNAYDWNENKKGENLYGTYLVLDKLVPKAQLEPYLFWRTQPLVTDENKHKGDSDLVTTGLRFLGKLPHRLDYTAEVAFQRGTCADDDVSAWAGSWGLGYTVNKSIYKPRLLVEYNFASGDGLKGDGRRGTFDQLYAVNHSLYGIADQVGWRNTNNYKVGFEVQATKRMKIQFDINDFYLATLQDALYADSGSSVVTNTKAASRHVGWEPDLQVTYKLTKQVTLLGGFGRLCPGAFVKQSTAGFAYNYPYLAWEFKY